MKKLLLLSLTLLSTTALAAPYLTSNESTQAITHCALVLDTNRSIELPATLNPITKLSYCSFDMAGTLTGAHTAKVRFIQVDPVWGRTESTDLSFPFTRGELTVTQPASVTLRSAVLNFLPSGTIK